MNLLDYSFIVGTASLFQPVGVAAPEFGVEELARLGESTSPNGSRKYSERNFRQLLLDGT